MTTTVTGLYDSYADAKSTVEALEAAGISSSNISLIAHDSRGDLVDKNRSNAGVDAGTGAGIGAVIGGAGGVLTGLGMMAIPGVGPVVAAGWLVATAVGAAGGAVVGAAAGGIIGAMTSAGVDERTAHLYAEGVRRGGTVVAAKVADDDAATAREIIDRHRPVDPVTREAALRQRGWTGFNEHAPVYTPAEVEAERRHYL